MAVLRLITNSVVPPGGFRYRVGETGQWVPPMERGPHNDEDSLVEDIKAHLRVNGHSIPPDATLRSMIQEQICTRVPSEWCSKDGIPQLPAGKSNRFSFASVLQFTRTLVSYAASSRRISDEEITKRAQICASCPNNTDPEGCSGCSAGALTEAVSGIVAGRSHPMDGQLKSCAVCGCVLRAKVRMPTEILVREMPEEQLERLPAFCWLKK